MKKRKAGMIFMLIGMLLLAASFLLTAYNIWDNNRAGERSEDLLEDWDSEGNPDNGSEEGQDQSSPESAAQNSSSDSTEEDSSVLPYSSVNNYSIDPDREMPVKEIDGMSCIATIQIPELGLYLPVINEWTYPNLRVAPCRYSGSMYSDDLVICGHNYSRHFGGLRYLNPGAQVILTDAEDHVFYYTVSYVEVLNPSQVEEMVTGDWDLTLFTCTLDTTTRVTVRCVRA